MHNLIADDSVIHKNIFKIAEFGINFALSDPNLDRFIKRFKNSIASAKRQLSRWIKIELKSEKIDPSTTKIVFYEDLVINPNKAIEDLIPIIEGGFDKNKFRFC